MATAAPTTVHSVTVTSDRWAECSCGVIFTGARVADRSAAHAQLGDADPRLELFGLIGEQLTAQP